ncbi:unnamed protein product [Hymenolepis diminuta]|uniref:Uncharacterized protein n=1 Tax=Hymenolepis diminuta TaxID=6216 RepID=A0A564Z7X7_HYMDI|nr:unnamed protein product [Hymenolepis diminuta]
MFSGVTASFGRPLRSASSVSLRPRLKSANRRFIVVSDNTFQLSIQSILRPFLKNPWEGAQTTIYTALTQNLHSGDYYADCKVAKVNPLVYDMKAQEEMVSASRKAVDLD